VGVTHDVQCRLLGQIRGTYGRGFTKDLFTWLASRLDCGGGFAAKRKNANTVTAETTTALFDVASLAGIALRTVLFIGPPSSWLH